MRRFDIHHAAVLSAAAAISLGLALGLGSAAGAASLCRVLSGAAPFPALRARWRRSQGPPWRYSTSSTGQVTVNWSASTTFSQMVSVPASSVVVGDLCHGMGSSSKKTQGSYGRNGDRQPAHFGKCAGGLGRIRRRFRWAPEWGSSPVVAPVAPSGGSFPGVAPVGPSGGRPPGGGSGKTPGGFANIGFATAR